jgi:hypothetical protein
MTEARCHECKNKCDNYRLYAAAVNMAFFGEGIGYGEPIEPSEEKMAAAIHLIPKLIRRALAECPRWEYWVEQPVAGQRLQLRRGWQIANRIAIRAGRTNEIA